MIGSVRRPMLSRHFCCRSGCDKLTAFGRQLSNPDHVLIRFSDAKKQIGLSVADLGSLAFVEKEDPYHSDRTALKSYRLPEVVTLALSKHKNSENLLIRYKHYLENEQNRTNDRIFGYSDPQGKKLDIISSRRYFPIGALKPEDISGLRSVEQGLASNTAVATVKALVFGLSGSSAIFADLCHSIADVLNYCYRWWTVSRSSMKPADKLHPYGYARLRDVCADRSFGVLLFVGGIGPLLHASGQFMSTFGVTNMDLAFPWISIGMFGLTAYLEGMACHTSANEIQVLSKNVGGKFVEYVKHGRDSMPVATFLEALAGVSGALVGMAGVSLSYLYGSIAYDLAASALMALSVVCTSGFLLSRSQAALVGQTLPISAVQRITTLLESHPSVVSVYDVKSELIGPETVRFKAEVEFNAEEISKRRLRLASDPTSLTGLHAELVNLPDASMAEDWVMKNDSAFLLALTKELKGLEKLIRTELRLHGFSTIHIDLEPW